MTLEIPDNDELNAIVMTGDVIMTLKNTDNDDELNRIVMTRDVIMTLKIIEIDSDIENHRQR